MITVLGGSGFVGSRLCERFNKAGAEFEIVDKAPSATFPDKVRRADVRSVDGLRAAVSPICSLLINLAAEHRDDVRPRSLYDDVNVHGARNICQVAEEKGVERILFTSSVACYGFAAPHTAEDGPLNPFNDYGRTKAEAEAIFKKWQAKHPDRRSLVIVRPTVIFGERNRGNVYNLLRQVATGRFIMIGTGRNTKSMAYVENVAAFLEYCCGLPPGAHLFNYVDKPDLDMLTLVTTVRGSLGKGGPMGLRLPYPVGLAIGMGFDAISRATGRTFPISAIRVKKFCSTTQFATSAGQTGFRPPVSLREGLQRTVRYEFLEKHVGDPKFYTE